MSDVYVFNNFFSALESIMDRFGVKSIECGKIERKDEGGLYVYGCKFKGKNCELIYGDLPRIVVEMDG